MPSRSKWALVIVFPPGVPTCRRIAWWKPNVQSSSGSWELGYFGWPEKPLEHTPDPEPTVYEGIPFIWGFGEAWGILQGYVGVLLEPSQKLTASGNTWKWMEFWKPFFCLFSFSGCFFGLFSGANCELSVSGRAFSLVRKNSYSSSRWFQPWPFYPQSLEVTNHQLKGSLKHPKKVTKNCQDVDHCHHGSCSFNFLPEKGDGSNFTLAKYREHRKTTCYEPP